MNLFALSTGFILKPSKVIEAFYRGCRSKNLYYLADSMEDSEFDQLNIQDVRLKHLETKDIIKHKWLRQIELVGYLFCSMIIHIGMLVAGKALLTAEWIKNKIATRQSSEP